MEKFRKNYGIVGLCVVVVVYIIYNIPFLSLPYYWDEAWSYIPAVEEMVSKGSSMLPGSISVASYKGHPLFFYFISSVWLQLFHNNIFWSKCLALIISVFTLLYTFLLAKFLTRKDIAALLSVIYLASQDIFLAQSTMVLPEMLLALLSLMGLYYYFKNKFWIFFLSASLLMLTKETGIILVISILFSDALFFILEKKGNFRYYIVSRLPLYLAFTPVSLFFIYQKFKIGWFFYPEHIGYIDLSHNFFNKLNGYSSFLFLFQGRNIAFVFILLLLLVKVIKNKRLKISKMWATLLIFILFYLAFLSANFYSTRYILSLIPIFSILSIWGIFALLKNKYLLIMISSVFIIFSIAYTSHNFKGSDTNIGYRNVVYVQKEMVRYCEDKDLYNCKIATHFLMRDILVHPLSGYLSNGKIFRQVEEKIGSETNYVIVSSNEQNKTINLQLNTLSVSLLKKYTKKQAWCKLFIINRK